MERPTACPLAIGPCVVTADELDPQAMFVQVKVDDDERAEGQPERRREVLFGLIATVSTARRSSSAATRSRSDPSHRAADDADPRGGCGRARWSSWPPRGSAPCGTGSEQADRRQRITIRPITMSDRSGVRASTAKIAF